MSIYLISVFNFTIALLYTPGPNNTMLMNSGLHFGYRRTLGHLMGIQFGFMSLNLLVALGLGQVFLLYPPLQIYLAMIGSAYMVYLAYLSWNSGDMKNAKDKLRPMSFLQAALFQYINPKAWIIAIAALTSYTHTEYFSYYQAAAIVIGIFFLNGFGSSSFWVLLGVMGGKILAKRPDFIGFVNKFMAFLLVLSVILLWI